MTTNTAELVLEVLRRTPMNVLDQACAEACKACEIAPRDGETVIDDATALVRALALPYYAPTR